MPVADSDHDLAALPGGGDALLRDVDDPAVGGFPDRPVELDEPQVLELAGGRELERIVDQNRLATIRGY
jgi:hypothetical protein